LAQRHGPNVHHVLAEVKANPRLKSHVCICEPVIEAEIRYCVRQQWVRTLDDLRKRTRLGTGPCQGTGCTLKAAAILADALGQDLDYARRQVEEFLQERWAGRRPVLGGAPLAQEELLRAYYQCLGGFGQVQGVRDAHE
jgi:glycerol-3-phosphate dehydrogenase